jgi:hypothetical protein
MTGRPGSKGGTTEGVLAFGPRNTARERSVTVAPPKAPAVFSRSRGPCEDAGKKL